MVTLRQCYIAASLIKNLPLWGPLSVGVGPKNLIISSKPNMKAEKCHYSYIRYVLSYTAHK